MDTPARHTRQPIGTHQIHRPKIEIRKTHLPGIPFQTCLEAGLQGAFTEPVVGKTRAHTSGRQPDTLSPESNMPGQSHVTQASLLGRNQTGTYRRIGLPALFVTGQQRFGG